MMDFFCKLVAILLSCFYLVYVIYEYMRALKNNLPSPTVKLIKQLIFIICLSFGILLALFAMATSLVGRAYLIAAGLISLPFIVNYFWKEPKQ